MHLHARLNLVNLKFHGTSLRADGKNCATSSRWKTCHRRQFIIKQGFGSRMVVFGFRAFSFHGLTRSWVLRQKSSLKPLASLVKGITII